MNVIMLTAEQHACWVSAVAKWPTCQTCDGNGWTVEGPNYHDPYGDKIECIECVGGRVPQPVVLVIEGEPCDVVGTRCRTHRGPVVERGGSCVRDGHVPPVGWRVPAGEPVELRAPQERRFVRTSAKHGHWTSDYPVLVARATVELLPVVGSVPDYEHDCVSVSPLGAILHRNADQLIDVEQRLLPLDPLPVPGRHWVAICTPETTP